MPGKDHRWPWKGKRLFSRSKGQEGRAVPPTASANSSESTAGSLATDASLPKTVKPGPLPSIKELQSQPAVSPPNPSSSSVEEPATTPSAEHSPARDDAQKEPAIQPEQIWDQAYDDLKRDEPALLEFYESILSHDLDSSKGAKGNIIELDRKKRRSQMDHLLDAGMDKTAKLAKVEKDIGDTIKVVLSVKEAIGSGLQAVPIAALAWTGVCIVLEVFQNPIKEATANREGIVQVVSNMKWYSSLSKLLLEETSQNDERFAESRRLLTYRILDLYKALLKYIIKSICAYYRNPVLQHLRNLVKLDGWNGSLDDVNKAENSVKAASSALGVQQANSYLGLLVNMRISEAKDEIMQKLCVTDMDAEIKSLQQRKDDLLADSYKWILDNKEYRDFTDWQQGNTRRLLWIKGDAGKGKTMLLIGIVTSLTAELETHFDRPHLSYFFCQATNGRLNTATSILRGLIWMLVHQQKSLIRHLDRFKDLGSTLFEAHASFYNLKDILLAILGDKSLERAYLAVDALDECKKDEPGLKQLLELISEAADKNNKVKWLVTSRNEAYIGDILNKTKTGARLSLELNADSVTGAVNSYIDKKMLDLTARFKGTYADSEDSILKEVRQVREQIAEEVRRRADGTFLWVALVFRQIHDNTDFGADEVLKLIYKIPRTLNGQYDQMMDQIIQRNDTYSQYSKQVLLIMVNAYPSNRPLHLSELVSLAALPATAAHSNIIRLCGVLTIKEDDRTVYFVHQSAKDYLTEHAKPEILSKIFPNGRAGHQTIVSRSLTSMGAKLHRDICTLKYPGFPITDVQASDLAALASIRYACVYWVDHLCGIQDGHDIIGLYDMIDNFLKKHFLHWLEALSLMSKMSEGVFAVDKLASLLSRVSLDSELLPLVQDARRFILSNRGVIENAPLQAYSSALIFSPVRSLTRERFKDSEPDWITTKPPMEAGWGACMQTLEGHSDTVTSVAFSHDGTRVASGSSDGTVKIWDAGSGACLETLEGHSDTVTSVAFSHDGTRVASGSYDGTVKIWDAGSGACLETLEGHSNTVYSVAFSHDGTRVASGSDDGTVKIWDAGSGACLETLEGHSSRVYSVAFSHDGTRVASGSDDTVKIWDAGSGACLKTLEGHSSWVTSVAFSHDGTRVASGSDDHTVKIWDAGSGACLKTLEGHSDTVYSVAFSHDGTRVASGSDDHTVKIWDAGSGACLKTLEGHSDTVYSVAFSHDGTRVASGSDDNTVKIWDAGSGACLETLEGHSSWVTSVAFSHDGTRVASGSYDHTVKIWDAGSGACLKTLEGHSSRVTSVAFSHDGTRVASGSYDRTVKIWDAGSGACLKTLEGHSSRVTSVAFSHDGTRVASGSYDHTVKIWDAGSGACLKTLEGHSSRVTSVAFSHNGTRVASGSDDTVKIWDAGSGACLETLDSDHTVDNISFDSAGSSLLTSKGIILLDMQSASNTTQTAAVKEPQRYSYSLSADRSWVIWNDRNVLWLPPEYRPPWLSTYVIAPYAIAIGCSSGRVIAFKFSPEKSPLSQSLS